MILWINGAFGSGKSSVAEELSKKVGKSFVYDPGSKLDIFYGTTFQKK